MPETKKNNSLMDKIKENIVLITLAGLMTIAGAATFGKLNAADSRALENEKRLIAIEENQKNQQDYLIKQLQTIAIELGDIDSTTRTHESAITRLETLIEVLRSGQ